MKGAGIIIEALEIMLRWFGPIYVCIGVVISVFSVLQYQLPEIVRGIAYYKQRRNHSHTHSVREPIITDFSSMESIMAEALFDVLALTFVWPLALAFLLHEKHNSRQILLADAKKQ